MSDGGNVAATVLISLAGFLVLWTTSIVGGLAWLNSQFSRNRNATYTTAKELKDEFNNAINSISRRVTRLEHWRIAKEGRVHNDDEPSGTD